MKEKMEDVTETVEESVEQAAAGNEEESVPIEEVEIVDDEDGDEDGEEEDEPSRLRRENAELSRRVLRAHADLENFKKRNIRERQESIKFANKEIFLKVLDVLDNFDRAMMAAHDPKDNFVIGVAMIQRQLVEVLTSSGVEEIDAMGKAFDPYLHEAMAREETGEHPENTVIEIYQKGYRFQGSLLRPAKVKVAAAPDAGQGSDEAGE